MYRWMSPHSWRCRPRKYLVNGRDFPSGMTNPNKRPRAAMEDISIKSKVSIQTSLHQKTSISKIPWEYSCFRQKNVFSDYNWTLLIFWPIVISDSYPLNRAIEHYFRRRNVHFLALKMDGNNEVCYKKFQRILFQVIFSLNA